MIAMIIAMIPLIRLKYPFLMNLIIAMLVGVSCDITFKVTPSSKPKEVSKEDINEESKDE